MTNPGTPTHKMIERKVGDLWVDPQVQRSLKKSRVQKMAGEFRPEALGVLTTSHRSADRIHVIDGQHRYRAAEMVSYGGLIQTMEYHGLDLAEEAALFRLLNATEKPSRVDQFLVSCIEQNPASLRLAHILHDHGWTVGVSATTSQLSAIGSLERVYALSPGAADAALGVLTASFGRRPAAVQGALVEGLGKMIARYGQDVELSDLTRRLAGFPGGPDGLMGTARGQSLTRSGTLATQVARVITNIYNQRRRTTALPEWQ